MLAILGLVISTTTSPGAFVRAQDDADAGTPPAGTDDPNTKPPSEDDEEEGKEFTEEQINVEEPRVKEFFTDLESSPVPLVKIQSIEPENGPITGKCSPPTPC